MCFRPPSLDAGPVKCPKCGAEVDPTLDQCPNCGAKADPAPPSAGIPTVLGAPGAPAVPAPGIKVPTVPTPPKPGA